MIDEYIPNKIIYIQSILPERVAEYKRVYTYDANTEKYICHIITGFGIRKDRACFAECFSNASYSYLFSICMCAYKSYSGKHVACYIKRMIKVSIICSLNTYNVVQEICKNNNLRPFYLDDDRKKDCH